MEKRIITREMRKYSGRFECQLCGWNTDLLVPKKPGRRGWEMILSELLYGREGQKNGDSGRLLFSALSRISFSK